MSTRNVRRRPTHEFLLQPLEARRLLCTLEGTHIEEFHGPESTETEPNDTLATANPFGGNDSLNGTLSSSADVDYWVTTLNQGDRLRVRPGTDPGQRHYKPLVEVLDSTGAVMLRSGDGHEMNLYAPSAGPYYVRISSASSYGTFTGSYGLEGGSNLIAVTVSSFSGTTETEPNDTPGSANALAGSNFRGALSSSSDVDTFSFFATAGNFVVFKFNNAAALNPSLRLYDPSNNLIASNLGGAGLAYVLPSSGTYRFALSGDNSAGAVSGGYVGTLLTSGGTFVTESEPLNNSFDGAVPWTILPTATRAVGQIDSVGDVDLFRFEFRAGRWYSFSIDSNSDLMMRGGRQLTLFNELGQPIETSYIGTAHTNAATGFGFRIERSGRHYLAVEAIDPVGVGGYSISGNQTSSFPTQRDIPLVFHDYTGQRTHLGYGPAQPLLNPASIPAFIGMFEARYDVYDVDVTTENPGSDVIGFGAGEFGSIGAYGYGGSFNLGTRRARGDSLLDDSGANFTSLANIRNPASVMNQEIGHAAGLYAHARNPLAFMAYDNQSAMNVIGNYYPFPWTDSRVPDVESRNEREFQDWVLQAGRIAEEVEPNNSLASPQSLSGFMSEMTSDGTPRNDRVALSGLIDSSSDVDVYSFTASAGQTFAFDIDAAEFQHSLDATIRLFDNSGNFIAANFDAIDRDTGLDSVDPYLVHTFATAGTYKIQITGNNGTVGNYRLKLISGAAFDTDGPRVIASWPNGGASVDGTRQLLFWIDDKLDPSTLTASNIIVQGNSTGVRSGSAIFDPSDSVLIWRSDVPLPPDTYTVTFRSGASGIKDLRGNPLDGETDGMMSFPEISGDGAVGGDFTTTFTIFIPDTSAATISSSSIRRHPYNRVLFTLNFSDELDVQSVYTSNLTLRGAGADNAYNTSDDYLVPIDVLYDKIKLTGSSRPLEVYSRGVPDFGNYRLEGAILDAAGNSVVISRTFSYTTATSNLASGPSVSGMSISPGTAVISPVAKLNITFSAQISPSTLSNSTFVLRYSPDAVFFNGNDTIISDADGIIAWDATNLTAEFEAAATFADGYYLVELDGDAGGIARPDGSLLDGEWLDSRIAGNTLFSHWQDAPSGDGFAGGDWRAMFVVAIDNAAPIVEASSFVYQNAPQRLRFHFSENVGASFSTSDILLENLTTSGTIPPGLLNFNYDFASNTATLTFPGLSDGILPDGQYRATLLASGITDPSGNPLASNHVFNFFFLQADANHDGAVNLLDFNILAANFGQTNRDFTQGDFNYDTVVNLQDFNILAGRFGHLVSPAGRESGSLFATNSVAIRYNDSHRFLPDSEDDDAADQFSLA